MIQIVIVIFLIVLVLFMPVRIGRNRNPYDVIRQVGKRKETRSIEKYDQAFWGKAIKAARKMERIIPITIKSSNREKMQDKINYAGMQKVLTVEDVQAVKLMFFVVALSYFGVMALITSSPMNMFLGLIATMLAYVSPEYLLSIKAKKRQAQMSHELPNVLTSLAIITDAGLNLVPAIDILVHQSKGVFLNEMKKALEEIQIGISQKEAFLRLSYRCNVEEIHYFISALLQGLEKGNSGLTAIIRQQAEESWQKRKYKAKELAEKASMKLFLPLLCMVFPAFAIFLIGPMIFSLIKLFDIM